MSPLWWRHTSPSHASSTSNDYSHFQYANKWRSSVTCWRQRRPMNEVTSLIVLEHGLITVMHLISGMPYTSNIWVWWEKGGEFTYPIGTSPHNSQAQSCMCTSPYISLTNTPYLPVVHSVWHKDIFNTTKDICNLSGLGLSANPWPSGKIPMTYSPPFSNICLMNARWGTTNTRLFIFIFIFFYNSSVRCKDTIIAKLLTDNCTLGNRGDT